MAWWSLPMEKPKLLLAEDDPNLGTVLQEYLQLKGYAVELCTDGEYGWRAFQRDPFDLCILDVMMPRRDGFTLGRNIRHVNPKVPIIYVTAKAMKEDKIEGFTLGADDYITKPFSIEELLCRVQAVLRRSRFAEKQPDESPPQTKFSIGSFEFDAENRTLTSSRGEQQLSAKEAALLRLLCENIESVTSRGQALKSIWGDDTYFNARSMDVFITKLRKHIKSDPTVRITNIHGKGYKLTVCS